ncbi:MAG: trypsin-like peptidase domain-containing protein [Bacteroidales bacterium]|nr:trypsin-like peptidase domain-containing protein [Bacteroidales bacterium]
MKKIFFVLTVLMVSLSFNLKSQDFTLAAEKSVHSVVYIQCLYHQQTSYYDDFFNNDFFSQFFSFDPFSMFGQSQPKQRVRTYQTSGSGVIISSDGYIVTNNHVVADADSVTVTLNDRREYVARIIGTDADNDLAVIKIEASDLQPLEYGNSDQVKIGQWVLAVGNPFNLTSTVTAGIVSAKARNINILSSRESSNTLTSFIQTDAAMNPGNSGGALVNTQGELIGVNAAIASNTGSYAGYSFAIPVNIVKKVVNDIIQYGATRQASAGLTTLEIDPVLQNEKNLKNNQGVYIQSVLKDGSADKAGIQEGDIVKKINGKPVNTASEVNEIMTQLSPDETAVFEIERKGQSLVKNVKLSDQKHADELALKQLGPETECLGAKIREISDKERNTYRLSRGLVITNAGKGKLASQGLQDGFIITAIDNNVNVTLKDAEQLNKRKGKVVIEGFYPNTGRSYYLVLVL